MSSAWTAHGWRTRARRRGFTLIELMVVLVIIGVLAALIVPDVLERADDARITAARTDVQNLIFSFGADGQPGGEGTNADIGSCQ